MPVHKWIGIKRQTCAAWLSATMAVHFGHRYSGWKAKAHTPGLHVASAGLRT